MIKLITISILIASGFLASCNQDHSKAKSPSASSWAENDSVLKISAAEDPSTLDPRQVRDLPAVSVIHMFFEGLVRREIDGKLVPAIAESVDVSKDLKTYTFKIRDSYWSNGDPVTADDFVYAWKSLLEPSFPAPNAYQLYVIKGAKAAKEGKGSIDDVGVHAKDSKTLVVEMENPTPYFLELTEFHAYFPINKNAEKNHHNWAVGAPENFVVNGPFKLLTWAKNNVIIAVKNPTYWDVESVRLSKIELIIIDPNTALSMYELGDIDWAGSPLAAIGSDAIASLKNEGELLVQEAAGTHFLRFNTDAKPLDNSKFRKALSYAINRQGIVDHITQGNQKPAMRLVPPSMGLHSESNSPDWDRTKAKELLEEALNEMKLDRQELPTITLFYRTGETQHRIAQELQQEWSNILGIKVVLESREPKVFYELLAHQEYQIALGSWFADIHDPINFLEVFKYKNNGTNNTQWENSRYIELMNASSNELNQERRFELMTEAEKVLLDEMPIAPLYFATFNYVKKDKVQGVYFSNLGYLDFKKAFISVEVKDVLGDD